MIMPVVITLEKNEFVDRMRDYGGHYFSDEGLEALYDYLDSDGGPIEFDPIAYRCEFHEWPDVFRYAEEAPDDERRAVHEEAEGALIAFFDDKEGEEGMPGARERAARLPLMEDGPERRAELERLTRGVGLLGFVRDEFLGRREAPAALEVGDEGFITF
jgi:hypothetical protein